MRSIGRFLIAICPLLFALSAEAQVGQNLVNLSLTVPQYNQIYVADLDIQHVKSAGVLFTATLQSLASTPIQVKLKLVVNVVLADGTAYDDIADATTNPFTLQPGQVKVITNMDVSGDNPSISIESSNYNSDQVNQLKSVALATGKAPAGRYDFVLQCMDQDNRDISLKQTGSIYVTNPSRVELALPMDQSSVSTLFPHFQWSSNADTVVLSVFEQLPSQQSPEDVVSGVPFLKVTVPNATSPISGSFNYPPSGPGVRPLQDGRTYYWYVEVPSSSTRGSGIRSDIWSFTEGTTASSSLTSGGGINTAVVNSLKDMLDGTPFSNLAGQIQSLTGQATYDGTVMDIQSVLDLLKSMDKSKITSVTIQ